jgi:hypothetical protein
VGIKKNMTINKLQVVSALFFKTVDSKDAVSKATRMYARRVLMSRVEATCGMFIAMKKMPL